MTLLRTNINGTRCIDVFLLTDPEFPIIGGIFSMRFVVEHEADRAGNDLVFVTIIQFADNNIIVLT